VPGLLRRAVARLTEDDRTVADRELQHELVSAGATAVSKCQKGQPVCVSGTLRAVTLRPRAGVPTLEAELYDGSGSVLLIWLGRRRIGGIECARVDRDTGLDAAIAAAIATGVGVLVLRLVRRETLQQAISGFLGLAVAVWFARRSGEARGFFLPGIFFNIGYGLVFLASALIGRPLVGAIYAAVEGLDSRWREDRRLRRVFAYASIGWALVFASRAVVQGTLYVMDRPGLLAAARLLMGWPLTIGAVALTLAYVKRARVLAPTD
jgi:hypothetical protein